jgi:hypothetical protein
MVCAPAGGVAKVLEIALSVLVTHLLLVCELSQSIPIDCPNAANARINHMKEIFIVILIRPVDFEVVDLGLDIKECTLIVWNTACVWCCRLTLFRHVWKDKMDARHLVPTFGVESAKVVQSICVWPIGFQWFLVNSHL